MFHFRKRLRELAREEKEYERKLDIDDKGRLVLDVKLGSISDAYSKYSPQKDLRLEPELKEYFESENIVLENPLVIKVYNDELKESKIEQETLTGILKNSFCCERRKLFKSRRFNNLVSLWCLIVGLVILAASFSIQFLPFLQNIIFSSLEILAWVFLWEAADLFFFQRPGLNARYVHYSKLCSADVEFFSGCSNKGSYTGYVCQNG